jgi:hypothetical protein
MSYITALLLQRNNDQYINGGIAPGKIDLIPTPASGGYVFADYWAVPTTDGIVSGWQYIPTTPGALTKPDPQAVHAVRINSTQAPDTWWALGNSTQYNFASKDAECCTSPGLSMPTTISNIAACQPLCANSDGNQFGAFGLPSPDTGTYTANGSYNGTVLPQITGATAAALVIALQANASWGAIGTWAKTADNLTLTVTGAAVADPQDPNTLCVIVTMV